MNLLLAVDALYQGLPGDDSTVAVVKMLPPKQSVVLVGPPESMEDDEEVVMKLMRASGKKIVCGGSTSQMVARILNKEITMPDLFSMIGGDIPPISFIDGIDLVTEGALTLKKVLAFLTECNKSEEYLNHFMDGTEGDGAFRLAHMMICDCTAIHFVQGKADNIAHASINYSPISLGRKMKTVERIGEELKKLGKIVTFEQI